MSLTGSEYLRQIRNMRRARLECAEMLTAVFVRLAGHHCGAAAVHDSLLMSSTRDVALKYTLSDTHAGLFLPCLLLILNYLWFIEFCKAAVLTDKIHRSSRQACVRSINCNIDFEQVLRLYICTSRMQHNTTLCKITFRVPKELNLHPITA